jgi:hypothetical protein
MKILGFHGGGYDDCRLLEYKNLFHTSQETHYVSASKNVVFWDIKTQFYLTGDK